MKKEKEKEVIDKLEAHGFLVQKFTLFSGVDNSGRVVMYDVWDKATMYGVMTGPLEALCKLSEQLEKANWNTDVFDLIPTEVDIYGD